MRAWFLCALVLFCGLQAAQCCSCVENAFIRSRTTAIRDDFCFSSMVYSARLVGASCNCLTENTTLKCVNYTMGADSTQTAQVMTMGECEMAFFMTPPNLCADLSSALGVNTGLTQAAGLPTVNLTVEAVNERCPNVCPFNMVNDNDDTYERRFNPCQYTLELLEVFKPINTSYGTTLISLGPDVLSTCGDYGRILSIGETYLVGVGGACSPFSEWTTLESYSEIELDFLRELRMSVQCGALGIVPSALTILLLSTLVILMLTLY